MRSFIHGRTFSVYRVQGFDYRELDEAACRRLLDAFTNESFHGLDPHTYGFAKVESSGTIFYGSFAQQYEQPLRKFSSPAEEIMSVDYPYEVRHFVYVPSDGILVLERRKFFQSDLNMGDTRARIEAILTEALGDYSVSLEPYRHQMSREEIYRQFVDAPTVRVKGQGLKKARVSDDFIFFNPEFERNCISRELFNSKILPTIHALEITSVAKRVAPPGQSDDLRSNPLAKLLIAIADDIQEIEVYDETAGRTRTLKSHYDDRLEVEAVYQSAHDLTQALLESLADLPYVSPEIRPNAQLKFGFDGKDGRR